MSARQRNLRGSEIRFCYSLARHRDHAVTSGLIGRPHVIVRRRMSSLLSCV